MSVINDFLVYFEGSSLPYVFWSNIDQNANGFDIKFYADTEVTEGFPRYLVNVDADNELLESYFKIDLDTEADSDFFVVGGGDSQDNSDIWSARSHSYACPFNDSVTDLTTNTNTPAVNGTEQYDNGIIGKAFSADGASNIEFSAADILGDSGFSADIWFKPDSGASGTNRVLMQNADGAAENTYLIARINDSDQIEIELKDSTGSIFTEQGYNIDHDEWHNLVLVYNNLDKVLVYIDGYKRFEVSLDPSVGYEGQNLTRLGSNVNDAQYYTGLIDELRVLKSQLGPDYIVSSYSNKSNFSAFYSRVDE